MTVLDLGNNLVLCFVVFLVDGCVVIAVVDVGLGVDLGFAFETFEVLNVVVGTLLLVPEVKHQTRIPYLHY